MLTLVTLFTLALGVHCSDQRIIGGAEANIDEFPYQGSLRALNGGHSCGCVLVGVQIALTAAHCPAVTGRNTIWGDAGINDGQQISISNVIQHPNYGTGTGAFPNDLAILFLNGIPNSPAEPARISDTRVNSGDAIISGWGLTCIGASCGQLPNQLQAVTLPVISDSECSDIWQSNYNPQVHICVYNGNQGACNGDSGGPMKQFGSEEVIIGVTSWGVNGCDPSYPSVYTRLSSFYRWICDSTNNNVNGC